MATVKKCDRCGKYYEPCISRGYIKKTKIPNAIKLVIENCDGYEEYDGIKYDLCPTCMESLEKFLKGNVTLEESLMQSFSVVFDREVLYGTLKMENEKIPVYMGRIEGQAINDRGTLIATKRKFTLIER